MNKRAVTIPSDSNWAIWLWTDKVIGFGTIADYDSVQLLQTKYNRITHWFSEHNLECHAAGNYVIDLTNPDKPVLTLLTESYPIGTKVVILGNIKSSGKKGVIDKISLSLSEKELWYTVTLEDKTVFYARNKWFEVV
jgi:hypothetical protein